MLENLKANVIRAWNSPTLTTWASFAARMVNLVLVLPLVLHRFSPTEVALWQLFTSLVAMQMLAELGFGSTFPRLFAYAMGGAREIPVAATLPATLLNTGGPNFLLMSRVGATMQAIYGRLTWLAGAVLLVGGTWALLRPIGALATDTTHTTHTTHMEAWLAWAVLLLSVTISFRASVYSAFLQGTNHVALVRRWEALFGTCSILTSFVILVCGGRLLALVLANQIWVLLTAWRNRWLAGIVLEGRFRDFPQANVDPSIFAVAWAAAWRSGLGIFLTQGLVLISSLLYAQSTDLVAVASYLLGLRLVQIVSEVSQAPFYSKLPLLSRLWAQGDLVQLIAQARKGMALAYWAFVIPFGLAGYFGNTLFTWFGSNTPFPSGKLWGMLGLAFLLQRYGAMHLQLYSTTNRIVWHIVTSVSGVLFITVALVFFPYWGVLAIPCGLLAGNVGFYCWYSAWLSHRHFRLPWPNFDLSTFAAPLIAMLLLLLAL